LTKNFALTGAAGFVAPRHLRAIRETGNRLVAAVDPHDAVGVLDSYFPDAAFFTEFERFDRHVEKLRRGPEENRVHVVSVCTPNHLHDAHVRLALRIGADALCEKPLVLNPWNLDALEELEHETGRRVKTVLQLRVHPALVDLKRRIEAEPGRRRTVVLGYVTSRGTWYRYSWKGALEKSGGLATNIGIHFFDLLIWLFGSPIREEVAVSTPTRVSGSLELPGADVLWYLSIDRADLPFAPEPGKRTTYRSITIDGEEIEFTEGFTDLHTRVYEETLAGRGFGIAEARPSVELAYRIRHAAVAANPVARHPMLLRLGEG
jgi:UDP-N-acetyl-2-amino-2-deoxyglucuronate dehydrogenase